MKPYPVRLPSGYTLNMELYVYSQPSGPDGIRIVFVSLSSGPGLELIVRGPDATAFDAAIDRIIAAQGPPSSN